MQFDVSKLEQRIGRIDRFGRKKGIIKHRFFFPIEFEASVWDAWFSVLVRGFQIFHRSVSDVHFLIGELTDVLMEELLHNGTANFEDKIIELSNSIDQARQEQNDQHALDKLSTETADKSLIASAIDHEEINEIDIQRDFERWFLKLFYYTKNRILR